MRSSDSAGRSIRSDVLYPALSGEWEVPVTRNAKITGGWGAPPLRDHLWQGPPLPVTLRLTQRLMTAPLPPLHRLSTASLTSVRIASLFSLFSFAIFFGSTKRIFPDSGVPYPLVSTVGFAIFAIARWGTGSSVKNRGCARIFRFHPVLAPPRAVEGSFPFTDDP